MDQYRPDGQPIKESDFFRLYDSIDDSMAGIDLDAWATKVLLIGLLWSVYEITQESTKPLEVLARERITRAQAFGLEPIPTELSTIRGLAKALPLSPVERNALMFALQSAGASVRNLTSDMKNKLQLRLVQAKMANEQPAMVTQALHEMFDGFVKDWRKIAISEAGNIATNGFVMSQAEGQKVIGQSAADCCRWCRELIHGKVYTITHKAPDELDDPMWDTHIWPGKTNIGRSRHAKSAAGAHRSDAELWTPCILLHPSCRCRWNRFDPRFHDIDDQGFLKVKG